MPKPRVPVPPKMQASLLKKNGVACCVCKARHVGLNFHHIDGDHSNTVEANLAVLCVSDHDAHHRPEHYRPDAATNHVDLGAAAISAAKVNWEAFVAEAAGPEPAVLATATCYGTEESIHSMKVVFQWVDGRIEFERTYHLHQGAPDVWIDWALSEMTWLGKHVKLALTSEPQPVEHCPCCGSGVSTFLPSGMARRLTSPTWKSSSVAAIYVNPHQASLAIHIEDAGGAAFDATLHRCGDALHFVSGAYEERMPITRKPSVRSQATGIVNRVLHDWDPGRTMIGTGPEEQPTLLDDLNLPRCWERPHASHAGRRRLR